MAESLHADDCHLLQFFLNYSEKSPRLLQVKSAPPFVTSSASYGIDCRSLTYRAARKTTVETLSTQSLTEVLRGDGVVVRDPIVCLSAVSPVFLLYLQ